MRAGRAADGAAGEAEHAVHFRPQHVYKQFQVGAAAGGKSAIDVVGLRVQAEGHSRGGAWWTNVFYNWRTRWISEGVGIAS